MKQGFSGSAVQRKGNLVEKVSSDQTFMDSQVRQNDLVALSLKIAVLPHIDHVDKQAITMEFIEGREGLTEHNAQRAGQALRLLHEQRDYPHPCMNGVDWLVQMANTSLAHLTYGPRIMAEIGAEYPSDALIHSEPVQFIETQDGSIVFIDIEGIGMGTRYQDLGYIYYSTAKEDKLDTYNMFLAGYEPESGLVELVRVKQLAGIISLAYAQFADFQKRMDLGLRLLGIVS